MLIYYIQTINFFLAVGGLGLLVCTLALIVDYVWCGGRYTERWLSPYLWHLTIGVTVFSVALSLLYSEYFGFVPCSLCWLQRIAIYPLSLMSIMAWWQRDTKMFPLYGIGLSVFGFVVAVYQYIYQMLPKDAIAGGVMPCLADGTADCADKVIDVFGFVTFPFLSAVTFVFLIVLYLHMRRIGK
jgi:disulfide bond formation protein DsbB